MFNVLVGCTGSVAALKLPILLQELEKLEINETKIRIRVVVTEHSTHFFPIADIPQHIELYRDEHEWKAWSNRGDPVIHIDLAKWADLFVIAPLDANTLGKISNVIFLLIRSCMNDLEIMDVLFAGFVR